MADLYTVLMHDTDVGIFGVYTATDPTDGSDWSPVAGAIVKIVKAILSLWVYRDGTDLHVVTQEVNPWRVAYHKFNMTTEVWDVEDEEVDLPLISGITDAKVGCSIAVRSDGDVIVLYIHGSAGFSIIEYARRESSVWTKAIVSSTVNSSPGVIVKGTSDRMHFFWSAAAIAEGRTLKSDNTFGGSVKTVYSDSLIDHSVGPGVSYDDGGTERIRVPVRDGSSLDVSIIETDSVDDPTFASSVDVSENTVEVVNDTILAALSVQTKELQLLYVDVSGDDIYLDKNDDDAGWGTDTQEIVSTVVGMSQNSRGSVISIIYQISGGDLTYAEIGAGAPPVEPTEGSLSLVGVGI